ncbi:Single-stranded DNA-binding protein [uncultured Caudovirales phage]|uniref:Single-stranded DNA-binding protein n=1 Tax=uncultured Caudovirales phage TaxID=2100421 RepID=A0A6J5MT95_9CAUD|nr:Single-stranded DNA-binding protein [uncultured Caudovirales phage]
MKSVSNAIVATTPRFLVMADGDTAICSFRVADNHNDEGFTYWYTITTFNELAYWVQLNISKGNRIDVSGEVKERLYYNEENELETLYEIVANKIVFDDISSAVSVEDQAEADAIADSAPKKEHVCSCKYCYANA